MKTQKKRSSNLELFRIVSMLAIIAHHYVVNSGLTESNGMIFSQITNWRSIFLLIFGAWGKTGINCFILITGYFMCKSNISIRKYVKLLAEIYVYRIGIYIILFFAGYETFGINRLIKLFLPVSQLDKGFTSCFLVFYLCIPFLNILVHNMTRKMHICLLVLLGTAYIILPTFSISVSFNYVTWFCVLYFIAAYIKIYFNIQNVNAKSWGVISALLILASVASIYVCSVVFSRYGISPRPFYFVADSNKMLSVILAVSLFMFFLTVKIGYSRVINTIASTTFGILCIHASSDAMRQWLWKDFVDCVGHYEMEFMPLYAIGCVLIIFTVCSLIDLARIRLLEKPFLNFWDDKLSENVNKCWNNIVSK